MHGAGRQQYGLGLQACNMTSIESQGHCEDLDLAIAGSVHKLQLTHTQTSGLALRLTYIQAEFPLLC